MRRSIGYLLLYVLATIIVSCVALIVNAGMIYAIYSGIAPLFLSESLSKPIGQLAC